MAGHAGDDHAGTARGDDATELIQDRRDAEQVDPQDGCRVSLRLDQDVFRYRSRDVASRGAIPAPPFSDSFWNGPPLHGVVLRGELVEWSCDAIGWLAEVIADSAALFGVRTPLLFPITRT